MSKIISVMLCLFLVGCAQPATFRQVDDVVYARVHIVSDKSQMPADAQALFPGLRACAYKTNDIYVVGTMTPAGIEIDPWIFGHEMLHLISWQTDGRVRNPDE